MQKNKMRGKGAESKAAFKQIMPDYKQFKADFRIAQGKNPYKGWFLTPKQKEENKMAENARNDAIKENLIRKGYAYRNNDKQNAAQPTHNLGSTYTQVNSSHNGQMLSPPVSPDKFLPHAVHKQLQETHLPNNPQFISPSSQYQQRFQQGVPQGFPHQQGGPHQQGVPHQQGFPHQQMYTQGVPHQQMYTQGVPHQQMYTQRFLQGGTMSKKTANNRHRKKAVKKTSKHTSKHPGGSANKKQVKKTDKPTTKTSTKNTAQKQPKKKRAS